MKTRVLKKGIACFIALLMMLGSIPQMVFADINQLLRNTSEENETLLDLLQNFDGSEEQADELLRSVGLMDEDGNMLINHTIYLNGVAFTLEEIKELLDDPTTDLTQIAWIDGTPVSLYDLRIMIEIEEELERIRAILESNSVFTDEHMPYLDDLLNQIENNGINFANGSDDENGDDFLPEDDDQSLPEDSDELWEIGLPWSDDPFEDPPYWLNEWDNILETLPYFPDYDPGGASIEDIYRPEYVMYEWSMEDDAGPGLITPASALPNVRQMVPWIFMMHSMRYNLYHYNGITYRASNPSSQAMSMQRMYGGDGHMNFRWPYTLSFGMRLVGADTQPVITERDNNGIREVGITWNINDLGISQFESTSGHDNTLSIFFYVPDNTGTLIHTNAQQNRLIWPGDAGRLHMNFLLEIHHEDAYLWRGARAFYLELYDLDGGALFHAPHRNVNHQNRITIPLYVDNHVTDFASSHTAEVRADGSLFNALFHTPLWPHDLPTTMHINPTWRIVNHNHGVMQPLENARRLLYGDTGQASFRVGTWLYYNTGGFFGAVNRPAPGQVFHSVINQYWTSQTNYFSHINETFGVLWSMWNPDNPSNPPLAMGGTVPDEHRLNISFRDENDQAMHNLDWNFTEGSTFDTDAYFPVNERSLFDVEFHGISNVNQLPSIMRTGQISPIYLRHGATTAHLGPEINSTNHLRGAWRIFAFEVMGAGRQPGPRRTSAQGHHIGIANDGLLPFVAGVHIPPGYYYPGQIIPIMVEFSRPVSANTAIVVTNGGLPDERRLEAIRPWGMRNTYSFVHMFEYVVDRHDGGSFVISEIREARDILGNVMIADNGRDSLGNGRPYWGDNVNNTTSGQMANVHIRSFFMAYAVESISLDRYVLTNTEVIMNDDHINVTLELNQLGFYRSLYVLFDFGNGNNPPLAPFEIRVTRRDGHEMGRFPMYLYEDTSTSPVTAYARGTIYGFNPAASWLQSHYIVEVIAIDGPSSAPDAETRVLGVFSHVTVLFQDIMPFFIPPAASLIVADQNAATQVSWFLMPDVFPHWSPAQVHVEVFRGNHTDPNNLLPIDLVYEGFTSVRYNFYVIPEDILATLSAGDIPSYTVRISADIRGEVLMPIAHILVVPPRARVNIIRPANTSMLQPQPFNIEWNIAPFEAGGGTTHTEATLTVTRVTTVSGADITTIIYDNIPINTATGSHLLNFAPVNGLRDLYMINIQARTVDSSNSPIYFYSPWSTDSLMLRVYRPGALQISGANRAPITGDIILCNLNDVSTMNLVNLSTAEIQRLRETLGLMEFVGINYDDYAWSMLHDLIRWESSDPDYVSVNFRRAHLYENVERFENLHLLPETIMGLSGLRDGRATITATHAATGMTDSVDVDVRTLRNQVFIIQANPAIQTSLRYTPVNGPERLVYTNATGTIVLFEPEGIASNIYMRSENADGVWLGTLYNHSLISGEQDWTLLAIYPMNNVSMRLTARVDIFLRRPDGTPFTGNVTVRGGVYRTVQRVTAVTGYAQNARMGDVPNPLNMGSGHDPRVFTVGAGGRLSIFLDANTFYSAELGEDNNFNLLPSDRLQYIFEITEIGNDFYRPVLVYVNGSISARQIMRSGESVISLEEAGAAGIFPFVATQRIEYPGRMRASTSVRDFAGNIGPDEVFTRVDLVTTALIWGEDRTANLNDFAVTITDEHGFIPQNQVSEGFLYPFSSIPLVRNRMELSEDSLTVSGWIAPETKMGVRTRLSRSNTVISDNPAPFNVLDMNTFPRVREDDDVTGIILDLVESIDTDTLRSNTYGRPPNSMVRRAMRLMSERDSGLGSPFFRVIITPRDNDPSVFDALIWAGQDGIGLADVDYDQTGFHWGWDYLAADTSANPADLREFVTNPSDAFEDLHNIMEHGFDAAKDQNPKGMDIGTTLVGFYTAEIRYNFETDEWEIVTTGGGFRVGLALGFTWNFNKWVGPVPVTASLSLGGALMFEFTQAIRHAPIQGYPWADDASSRVNDYLTQLRINAYVRIFAGLGFDKSVVALKVGIFGALSIDNTNRWLSRTYLADESAHQVHGQGLSIGGEIGIRFEARFIFLSFSYTFVSIGASYSWTFNEWDYIAAYWRDTDSGLGQNALTAEINQAAMGLAMVPGFELAQASATLASRDYLHRFARRWGAPDTGFTPLQLDTNNRLDPLQSNAYPESRPVVSDDGQLLLYLYDQGSDDIRLTRVFATEMAFNGTYPKGTEIPAPTDGSTTFTGHGDVQLRLAGNQNFAAATWVRMNSYLLGRNAGDWVTEQEQSRMMGATDIVASIFTGGSWVSTRLTEDYLPNLAPVVATNGTDRAIVAWRSVFAGDSGDFLNFDVRDQIVYRIFENGTWGDTVVLYNGMSGSVKGIEAAMLPCGTAIVAYTLDRGFAGYATDFEIAYSIVDANGNPGRSWIITYDENINANPQVVAVDFGSSDHRFVLGWFSADDGQGTVNLAAIDYEGNMSNSFIESISRVAQEALMSGNFRFASAGTLDSLSVVWTEPSDLNDGSDVMRAVLIGGTNISAPLEVAQMPPGTIIDHFNVYAVSATEVRAIIQATKHHVINRYDPNTFEELTFIDGFGERQTALIPIAETRLYTATATFENSVLLRGLQIEHANVAPNAIALIRFDIRNTGFDPINEVNIQVGTQTHSFTNLDIQPNDSQALIFHFITGSVVDNESYTLTPIFNGMPATPLTGTVHLDMPDVGISSMDVIREQDGERTVRVTLHNDSHITLDRTGRSVVVDFFDDSHMLEPIPGLTHTVSDAVMLQLIDEGAYSFDVTFDIRAYINDSPNIHTVEIPSSGVPFFASARIMYGGEQQPERNMSNNIDMIFFDSLLHRTGDNVSIFINQGLSGGLTTADVSVRNNSLHNRAFGNVKATLLDEHGYVLEVLHTFHTTGAFTLYGEAIETVTFNFSHQGSRVIAEFGMLDFSNANSDLAVLRLDNLPVELEGFYLTSHFRGWSIYHHDSINSGPVTTTRLIMMPHNLDSTIVVRVNDQVVDPDAPIILTAHTRIQIQVTSPDLSGISYYEVNIFGDLPLNFVPVNNVLHVPGVATVGIPLTLSGTIQPANATRQDIIWSVYEAGNTAAFINNDELLVPIFDQGFIMVRATILGGGPQGTDWTQEYLLFLEDDFDPDTFVSVTGVTNLPTEITVGTPLSLTGTVQPANATVRTLSWSLSEDYGAGAYLSANNVLTVSSVGTEGRIYVWVRVNRGEGIFRDWQERIPITVHPAPPPTVVSVSPSGAGIARTANQLIITFNEAMDPATASLGAVTVSGATVSNPVWSNNNTVVTYTLSGLAYSTTYAVNISGFRNRWGTVMAANHNTSFTTVGAGVWVPAPSPTPTTIPAPATTPAPITQPAQSLPLVWVELSPGLEDDLQNLLEDRFDDMDVIVETSPADDINGGAVTIDVSFRVDDEALDIQLNNQLPNILEEASAYYTIYVDLSDFVADGVNYHRFVAIYNGKIIGGGMGPDMIFSVDVSTTGRFIIAYVVNLRRLGMNINSYTIYDLAANAPVQTMDTRPMLQNHRTLIPIRFVAQALGAEVDWTPASGGRPLIVHLTLNNQTLSFPIGEITPELAAMGMDVPAQIVNNRTMVPLRFVSEFFGAVVNWDGATRGIEIISGIVVYKED